MAVGRYWLASQIANQQNEILQSQIPQCTRPWDKMANRDHFDAWSFGCLAYTIPESAV
jgi:hypothetical protein